MKLSLPEKFSGFSEHWHPYIIGELNDNFIKLAKLKGEFVWHKHDEEDELFVIIAGTLMMDFRDKTISAREGEIILVPKNTEHRLWTKDGEEVRVMLIEPKGTKHTGNIISEKTVEKQEWI